MRLPLVLNRYSVPSPWITSGHWQASTCNGVLNCSMMESITAAPRSAPGTAPRRASWAGSAPAPSARPNRWLRRPGRDAVQVVALLRIGAAQGGKINAIRFWNSALGPASSGAFLFWVIAHPPALCLRPCLLRCAVAGYQARTAPTFQAVTRSDNLTGWGKCLPSPCATGSGR